MEGNKVYVLSLFDIFHHFIFLNFLYDAYIFLFSLIAYIKLIGNWYLDCLLMWKVVYIVSWIFSSFKWNSKELITVIA